MLARICALLLALTLSACGGGGGDAGNPITGGGTGTPVFVSCSANLVIEVGRAVECTIGSGKTPYTAISSDVSVATAGKTSDTVFGISGVRAGSATVTVKDALGSSSIINVTVGSADPLFLSAPAQVALNVGAAQSFVIGGGAGPYTAAVGNSSIVTAKVTGSTLTLTGGQSGSTTVVVIDSRGTKVPEVNVTVGGGANAVALYTTAASPLVVAPGSAPTFDIGGGTGPYRATSSDASVVEVTVNAAGKLSVTGRAVGTASVVVTDAVGASKTLAVTVGSATVVALYTTAPADLNLKKGVSQSFAIGGGVGPYAVSSGNSAVLNASISGGALQLQALATGTASVSIFDSQGRSVTVSTTVTEDAPKALTVSPTTASGAVGESLTLLMFGGDPPYTVTPANSSVASLASQSANRFVLDLLKAGATSVALADARGQVQTVSVTVVPAAVQPLALSVPSPLALPLGPDRTVMVSGGVAPYMVGSGNEAVVRASNAGNVLTLKPLANGSAVVQITDSAGSGLSLAVNVGSNVPLFTTAPSSLTVVPGTSQTFTISGGTSPYFAESGNRSFVTASAAGSILTITGTVPGNSVVAVRDSVGATVNVAVTVGGQAPLFTSAPASVVMSSGAEPQRFIMGGGSPKFVNQVPVYEVSSSNPAVVTVSATGTVLTVTGVASGTSTVTVLDALGARASFSVTVGVAVPLHTTAPAAVSVAPGLSNAQNYEIRGGSAPYVVTSSNVAVTTAAVTGANLVMTGLAAGSANVVVTDRLGATVTIAVTVTAAAAQPLSVTPLAANGSVGDVLRFEIRGGSPFYTVTVNNQSIASATAPGAATAFNLTLTGAGATNIAVIDANGQVQNIAVTVQSVSGTPLFTSAPPSVNMSLGGVPRTFTVGGGSGSYIFATSDAGVVTVPSGSSTSLVLTAVGQGTATVTVTDTAGGSSSFAVTVGAVQPLVLSSGPAVTLGVAAGSTTYAISGGRSPYVAVSTNAAVVSVAPPGATGDLILTPAAAGTANVVVTDATGAQATLAVTVAQSGVVDMAVSPASLTSNVGEEVVLTITGGSSPYTVSSSNPAVAERITPSPGASPARFRVLNAGAATITVFDAAGQVQEVTLTATQAATQLRLSPTTLQLPETYLLGAPGAGTNLSLNVYGGRAPFVAYTTDAQRTAVAVTGSVVAVSQGTGSTLCSDALVSKYVLEATSPSDPTQAAARAFDIVITVVDSLGASATAKFVIIDDGQNITTPTCR